MVQTSSAWQLMLSGERGIWTLAPVLPTYSLSRGAPSASLGISPGRYLQSKFLNSIIFHIWFQAQFHQLLLISEAERMGFEPMCPWGQTVFKTAALWPLRYLSKTVAQHLFSLGSHMLFSREQMIYYQMHFLLSMLIFKYFPQKFSSICPLTSINTNPI